MTLDELLLEWSYRSEKGYPSLDSPSDVLLLEKILTELDLPTDDILNKVSYGNKDGKPGITSLEPSPLDGEEEEEVEPIVKKSFPSPEEKEEAKLKCRVLYNQIQLLDAYTYSLITKTLDDGIS